MKYALEIFFFCVRPSRAEILRFKHPFEILPIYILKKKKNPETKAAAVVKQSKKIKNMLVLQY